MVNQEWVELCERGALPYGASAQGIELDFLRRNSPKRRPYRFKPRPTPASCFRPLCREKRPGLSQPLLKIGGAVYSASSMNNFF
jgi:hypothetical protein